MRILINWCFETDGDFTLNNLNDYGCVLEGFEEYIGFKEFKYPKEATLFLNKMEEDLIADRDILHDFRKMISSIKCFIKHNKYGAINERMCGNYVGTYITLMILEK